MIKKDLNKLNFEQLKEEIKSLENKKQKVTTKKQGIWNIGKNYFIRTVTMYFLGRLVKVTDKELVMEEVSWIGDCGNFHDFLKNGQTDNMEVEPYPDCEIIIGRGSLIDAVEWKHKLLRIQK